MSQWHNRVKYGSGTFFLELGSDISPAGGDGQGGGLDNGGGGYVSPLSSAMADNRLRQIHQMGGT